MAECVPEKRIKRTNPPSATQSDDTRRSFMPFFTAAVLQKPITAIQPRSARRHGHRQP